MDLSDRQWTHIDIGLMVCHNSGCPIHKQTLRGVEDKIDDNTTALLYARGGGGISLGREIRGPGSSENGELVRDGDHPTAFPYAAQR